VSFTTNSIFPFGSYTATALNVGIPLTFNQVGIGASNSPNAIADRYPLPQNFTPLLVTAVCANLVAPAYVNVCYGEVAQTTQTATGATAVAGNVFFFPGTPQSVLSAGTVYSFTALNAGTIYPAGGELTLRVQTPVGGGIGGLQVNVWGTFA
jgi:hypothetical protein